MAERKRLQWQVGERTKARKFLRSEVLNKQQIVGNNII